MSLPKLHEVRSVIYTKWTQKSIVFLHKSNKSVKTKFKNSIYPALGRPSQSGLLRETLFQNKQTKIPFMITWKRILKKQG
jgi:hypothetical protein